MISLHTAESIGQELATRVSTRLTTNGAETNLGAAVYRGRRVVDDDMVPCTAVIEGSDVIEENDSTRSTETRIRQQYVLLGYVPCDPDHPNDAAHKAIRDLKKAIFVTDGKADRTLGGKVRRMRYRGRDIGPRADGAAFVVVSVEVEAEFAEDLSNP
jgi:hypothetical protein